MATLIASGLRPPWFVDRLEFVATESDKKQLEIHISFEKGARFKDETGVECPVHDSLERTWQHLSFFEHPCFLHARVPRIKTSTGKVKQVHVPWARPGSGFTLLFEAFAMCLIENERPVNKAAGILVVYPKRLWMIFNYWIQRAFHKDDQHSVTKIGIDETSNKKGSRSFGSTIAVDLDARRVLFATKGKDESTVDRLKQHLASKEVKPEQIEHISIDMSPAYISGIKGNFPEANIVFDPFHIVKLLNEAMDTVRKAERNEHQALKGHKYTFLKKPKNLSVKKRIELADLIETYPKLGEAYRLKELFGDFWEFNDKEQGMAFLAYWCDLVEDSGIPAFKKFANTLNAHWTGIVNHIESKISNGILEGNNSKIQLAKRRARGYRNIENLNNMIYFVVGKLHFDYPHYST